MRSKPVLLFLLLGLAALGSVWAANQAARVTQVVREVKIIGGSSPHSATTNETIAAGNGLRTGNESRAELTFPDLTITRVGANSIYSFERGGRTANLADGAILLRVPKDSGGARIGTPAVTVGITGTTVLFEFHPRTYSKLIVLEGSSRLWLNGDPSHFATLHAGQMIVVKAGATQLPPPVTIDLARVVSSAVLITQFPPLPSFDLIRAAIKGQGSAGPGSLASDPTGLRARDLDASTRPSATPRKRLPDNRQKR